MLLPLFLIERFNLSERKERSEKDASSSSKVYLETEKLLLSFFDGHTIWGQHKLGRRMDDGISYRGYRQTL